MAFSKLTFVKLGNRALQVAMAAVVIATTSHCRWTVTDVVVYPPFGPEERQVVDFDMCVFGVNRSNYGRNSWSICNLGVAVGAIGLFFSTLFALTPFITKKRPMLALEMFFTLFMMLLWLTLSIVLSSTLPRSIRECRQYERTSLFAPDETLGSRCSSAQVSLAFSWMSWFFYLVSIILVLIELRREAKEEPKKVPAESAETSEESGGAEQPPQEETRAQETAATGPPTETRETTQRDTQEQPPREEGASEQERASEQA